MDTKEHKFASVFRELKSQVSRCFPKTCESCGRNYPTLEDFLAATESTPYGSSFIEKAEFNDRSIVDILRNCPCGSTLMVVFNERRDMTTRGTELRKLFDVLIDVLAEHGVPKDRSRTELLSYIRGGESAVLEEHGLTDILSQYVNNSAFTPQD